MCRHLPIAVFASFVNHLNDLIKGKSVEFPRNCLSYSREQISFSS